MEDFFCCFCEYLCNPLCECFCDALCECFSENRNNIDATARQNTATIPVISEIIERPVEIIDELEMVVPINKKQDKEERKKYITNNKTSLYKNPVPTIRRSMSA